MLRQLFGNKNFLFHWAGGAIAHTGNFFTIVALPWLVLHLTDNNPVLMTSVLATLHVPQSFLLLFGGALVDLTSPLRSIILCRLASAGVLLLLSLHVGYGEIALAALYVYAFALGSLGAINLPANQSLIPSIVDPKLLSPANGITMGTLHLAQIVGPVLAGWTIWLARELRGIPADAADITSISFAFAVDAVAMVIAFSFALKVKPEIRGVSDKTANVFRFIAEGVRFCLNDKGIRIVLPYILLISFFLHGPLLAALPMLAKTKFQLAEGGYGLLYAMTGIGVVLGACVAIKLAPTPSALGKLTLTCDLVAGVMLWMLGSTESATTAAVLLLVMGSCSGTIMIAGTTWFQLRTADQFMGRVMSILMFCIFGLIPLSTMLSGSIINRHSIELLLQGSGVVIFTFSLIGLVTPSIRNMGAAPPSVEASTA